MKSPGVYMLVALLLAACARNSAAGDFHIWATDDMTRIDPVSGKAWEESGVYQQMESLGRGYRAASAVWDSASATISVEGARNEFVAFQVLVETPAGKTLEDFKLGTLTLDGPGKIESGDEITIYKEWYIQVRYPSRNYAFPLGLGWYPDVLIPVDSLPTSKLGAKCSIPDPVNAVPGQRVQAFWVDIWLPKSTPAGSYSGQLAVTAGGETKNLKINLTVWDITLPDSSAFAASLNSYGSVSSAKPKIRRQLFQIARAYRCVPDEFLVKPGVTGQAESLKLVWSAYDSLYGAALDGRLYTAKNGYRGPGEGIPLERAYLPFTSAEWPVGKNGKGEPWFEKSYHQALLEIEKHFESKKWTGTELAFFINDYDEPTRKEQFEDIRYFGRLLRSAPLKHQERIKYRIDIGHFADIQNRIPDWNTDTVLAVLGPVIDLWVTCAGTQYVNHRLMSKLVNLIGRDVWFYTSNTAGEPCIGGQYLDGELLGLRTWAWITWKYKITTGCIWEWTYGVRNSGDIRWTDPWTDFRLAAGNADACLVYHGRHVGVDQVLPAMRFMSLRRGAQDYEYFRLLTRNSGGNTVSADLIVDSVLHGALDETPRHMPGDWSHDPSDWVNARRRMAAWIVGDYK